MVWIKFFILAVIIWIFGTRLSKYGDILAEKTKMSKGFMGVLFLAAATSIPELVASSTSSVIGNVDLAAGNILGACMMNLLIIAILDSLVSSEPITFRLKYDHILSGSFAILMMCVVIMSLIMSKFLRVLLPVFDCGLFNVGITSIIILSIYILGVVFIFRFGKREEIISQKELYKDISKNRALFNFLLSVAVIIACGILITKVANVISGFKLGDTLIGGTLVGSILLSFATTMPELVVSISALKMGEFDMSVGNLLGSVMFNTSLLFTADLFYRKGPLMQAVAGVNAMSALFIIMSTAVIIVGLIFRSKRQFLRLGWDTLTVLLLYLTWVVTLCRFR